MNIAADHEVSPQKTFRVGTLIYTQAGLVSLFAWLLWGDFIYTFMEAVLPSLLPVLLKDHGASNREIAVIGAIYMVANAIFTPIISYRSDRFRSRWGRRRPFIFFTTPFVVLFLCAIPFAPEILALLQRSSAVSVLVAYSPVAPLILVFGVLVAGFQIFNMFISSVYYYLIPDVVPEAYLGRFYALFRVFGTLAGVVFNYFAFGYAETHMREIFVGSSVVYGVFILLMCWRVKEGEYPPIVEERGSWWGGIRTYARECFGHSYYWWVFIAYSSWTWAVASNVFAVFFFREELGLSLDAYGKMNAWSGGLFMILAYPFGVLMDRLGSHKVLIWSMASFVVTALCTYFFVHGATSAFVWMMIRNTGITLAAMALLKWTVDVYPRERYGQFGSAGALFSSIGGIILAPLAGWLMDWTKAYRLFLVWNAAFAFLGLLATVIVYRQWQRLGGPSNYRAP
jgi:maltose/moltooligosaccharide transporter